MDEVQPEYEYNTSMYGCNRSSAVGRETVSCLVAVCKDKQSMYVEYPVTIHIVANSYSGLLDELAG